jgi:hypothetical protein
MSASEVPAFLERHRGLFTAAEINELTQATVSIAGVGGVGGRVAEVLARTGIGILRVADPDVFTASNLNRQAASTLATLGMNKAEVVAEACRSVSPIIDVTAYRDGIHAGNVDDFVSGANVAIDATDYTLPSLGLMLARRAAQDAIPVVTGVEVAFSAWHTVIAKSGDFERLFALPRTANLSDLDEGRLTIPLWRWIASVPPYIPVDTLRQLQNGELEAPAIAPAVELSAALLATDVIRLILRQSVAARAPRIHMVDTITGRAKIFRPTRVGFEASLLRALLAGRHRT